MSGIPLPCNSRGICTVLGKCSYACGWKGRECTTREESGALKGSRGSVHLSSFPYLPLTGAWEELRFELKIPNNSVSVEIEDEFGQDTGF